MEEFLGTDVAILAEDFCVLPAGDLELVVGSRCLVQDIAHRLATPRGDLWAHPDYGVDLLRFIHVEDTALNRMDLTAAVAEAIEADPRVTPGSAKAEVTDWDRSTIRLVASFVPLGETNPVNLVLGYDLAEITAEVVVGLG